MKKLFSVFAVACIMASCNSGSSGSKSSDTTTAAQDTTSVSSTKDTTAMPPMTKDTAASAMKDGLMVMKGGEMMVMKAGSWQKLTESMKCKNGVEVKPNGEVSKGSRKKTLTEGMMIDSDGQMTDANGKLVDNAGW